MFLCLLLAQMITNSFRAIKEYCNSNNITFIAVSPIPSTKTDEADATVPTFVMNELIKNACIMLGITYKDLYNKCFNNYISNEGVGTFSDNKHPDDKMYYNMYYMYCDLLDIGAKYLPKPV